MFSINAVYVTFFEGAIYSHFGCARLSNCLFSPSCLNPLFTDLFSLFITPENIRKTDFLMFLMVKKEVLSAYKFMCIIMQMQETNFPVLIVSSLMFL